MSPTHYRSCTLCEATCGIAVTTDGDRVLEVRGDPADPFSKGYLCPKGTALADLHNDPDRLRRPIVRDRATDTWSEVSWDAAFALVASRVRAVQAAHGRHAVGVYQGNPTAHNLGLLTFGQLLVRALHTRNKFSATSLDQLPHMLAALQMFGNQLLMPVPDVDRADLFVCLGANPIASNGSLMTAPDMRGRLAAIRARGGRVIVLDPRRTETAERADQHLFIRPGSDAVLLLAMIDCVFAEQLVALGPLAPHVRGLEDLRATAAAWPAARAEAVTGIAAAEIRALARALATTPRAVLYGRIGVCTQELGGLAAWLCYTLNALTGHLDTPGGLMFTTPAIDPVALAPKLGLRGSFARYRSRVSGLPEFGGELPVAALAEDIDTPGPAGSGQIRALLTVAGNPVLSAPGGERLDRALAGLDFMVAIDPYVNETTRHADVILPPTSPLARAHYDLALNAFAVRNVAKYVPPLGPRAADERHDWEICLGLWQHLGGGRVGGVLRGVAARALAALGPEALLELGLRTGPYKLSLARLRAAPHGLDLGPLQPRLPARLGTRDHKVELAPALYLADLPRLETLAARARAGLVMIGRRDLRSNNSWMHNSSRLVKGPPRCTLLIHPVDAAARGLADGDRAQVSTERGAIELPVEVTESMMRGVVSVPHGWGHGRRGVRLRVAATVAGASVNDIIESSRIDALSGTAALTGQPVEVVAA